MRMSGRGSKATHAVWGLWHCQRHSRHVGPYAGPDVGGDARQPTRGPARSALAAAIIGATTNTHAMASYAPPPALPTSATAMPWAPSDCGSGSDGIQNEGTSERAARGPPGIAGNQNVGAVPRCFGGDGHPAPVTRHPARSVQALGVHAQERASFHRRTGAHGRHILLGQLHHRERDFLP